MKEKFTKCMGVITLTLLLVCGLIVGLANASPPNADIQQTTYTNFNDIVGATYDPDTNELFIIGQITGTLPMMDYDYLRENFVVAMRAVHAAPEYPGVTIGTTPSPDPSYQLVEYFGNITDTHYGYVFFEADRLLKSYSLGRDNLHPTDPFTSSVPGYESFFDRYLALEDTTPVPISQRFWFSPTLNLETAPGGDPYGVVFSNTKVNLLWAYLPGSGTSAEAEQAANDFVNHFNAHYDEFAAEQAARGNQTFYELTQLFKLFGIAHWAIDDTVQLNVSGVSAPWLENYPVTSFTTPGTTPTTSRTGEFFTGGITYTITISGGVASEQPTYIPNQIAKTIADDARISRPPGDYSFQMGPTPCLCPTDVSAAGDCPLELVVTVLPLSKNYVDNSSFEDGPASSPWVQYSILSYELIADGAGRSGTYGTYLGDYANADDRIYQEVTIPATAVRPMLIYYWFMSSTEALNFTSHSVNQALSELPPFITPHPVESWTPSLVQRRSAETPDMIDSSDDITPAAMNDFMYVRILDTSNNILDTLQVLTNDDVRNQWQAEGFSLDAYKGQTIRISFQATNDATNHTAFFIDDVSLDIDAGLGPGVVYLPIVMK